MNPCGISINKSQETEMINHSRRKVLKGMGYGIALSMTGVSSTALAFSEKQADVALPSCDITIYQRQTHGKEIVSLLNLTGQTVTLDSIEPVGLEHVNGSLVVKINHVADGKISLAEGERLTFEIEAISNHPMQEGVFIPNVLAGHVKISSDHPAFNGIIPVTVFDGQVG